jgi:hypothetical protein
LRKWSLPCESFYGSDFTMFKLQRLPSKVDTLILELVFEIHVQIRSHRRPASYQAQGLGWCDWNHIQRTYATLSDEAPDHHTSRITMLYRDTSNNETLPSIFPLRIHRTFIFRTFLQDYFVNKPKAYRSLARPQARI